MDISLEEIKIMENKCTQTEINIELPNQACDIVTNYQKIEAHWEKREQESIKERYTVKLLSALIGLYAVYKLSKIILYS